MMTTGKTLLLGVLFLSMSLEGKLTIPEVVSLIESLPADPKPKIDKTATSFTANFSPNNPKISRKIVGVMNGDLVELKMTNELENEILNFENLKSDTDKNRVSQYIKSFISHFQQIKNNEADIRAVLKAAIEGIGEFEGAKVSGVAEEKDLLVVSVLRKDVTTKVEVSNKGKSITFRAPSFESSYVLSSPTKNVIDFEAKKIFKRILSHLDVTEKLSRTNDGQTIRIFSCEHVLNTQTGLASVFPAAFAEGGVTGPTEGVLTFNNVGTISCQEKLVGDFAYLALEIKVGQENRYIKKQAISKESMFDLYYVVASLFGEAMKLLKYTAYDTAADEFVSDFEDENDAAGVPLEQKKADDGGAPQEPGNANERGAGAGAGAGEGAGAGAEEGAEEGAGAGALE